MNPVLNARDSKSYRSDRRVFVRWPLPVAELELADSLGGSVLDISEGGMAVQGLSRLTVENFSSVRFRLPESNSWIQTSCKVVWMNDAEDIAGVEFERLSDNERRQIQSWSQRLTIPEPPSPQLFAANRSARPGFAATAPGLAPALVPGLTEEPMFRSESWVREREGGSYGRWIAILAVIALGIVALYLASRMGLGLGGMKFFGTADSTAAPAAAARASQQRTGETTGDVLEEAPLASGQGYIVQVGAMRIRGNADALANMLQQKRLPILQFLGAGNLHVVAVGPFADQQDALATRKQLHDQGFDAIVRQLPSH